VDSVAIAGNDVALFTVTDNFDNDVCWDRRSNEICCLLSTVKQMVLTAGG